MAHVPRGLLPRSIHAGRWGPERPSPCMHATSFLYVLHLHILLYAPQQHLPLACGPGIPWVTHACMVTRPLPQGLTLYSKLHPAALPLLARLPHLSRLTLRLPCDRGTEDWSSVSAVGAALLPLLLGASSLERVHIVVMQRPGAEGVNYQPLLAAVQEGVLWLREQLRRLGWDPLMVTMKS